MEIIQIVIIGICATVFIVVLDKNKEFGIYLSIAVGVIILFLILDKFTLIMEAMQRLNQLINTDDMYIKVLYQILGIAFITEFGAQICKDSGQKAIAQNIEFAGKIIILIVSLPIMMAIVNLIETILIV